jgi:SH3 domain protein
MFNTLTAVPGGKTGRMLTCLFLSLLLLASYAAAETRFVYPDIDLPVRRGAGDVYKIIRMVKDGEQVELLENTQDGWAKVRFSDGKEGWIEQRLLTADPPSAQRMEELRTENSQLKEQVGGLEKNLAELNLAMTALKEHQGTEGDRTAACNAQLDALRAERRAEEDTVTAKHFVTVFGLFLIGWLLGRISAGPRRKPSRRLL